MRLLNTILDIVFPVNCLECGQTGYDFCLDCLTSSPQAERECAEWIFPLYDYRHPAIRKAITLLKYKRKKRLAKIFAEALYCRMLEELADLSLMQNFRNAILIPIPLSSARMRQRGFNQAELICKNLVELDQLNKGQNLKLEKSVLSKPKETKHQAHIENRSERLKNIIGSYALKNVEKIAGQNIILIDDVTTTGATLSEARKILKHAGARKVFAFTIAH
jgi:ComF family protein